MSKPNYHMMRSLSLLTVTFCLGLTLHAQIPDSAGMQPKKPNPTKQAVHQLKILQQKLNLTEDQVTQMQVILIQRDVALDSLRNNPSGDRRSTGRARRGINQDADQKIDQLLTPGQRPLYQQWKKEQKEKLMEKRQNAKPAEPIQ